MSWPQAFAIVGTLVVLVAGLLVGLALVGRHQERMRRLRQPSVPLWTIDRERER